MKEEKLRPTYILVSRKLIVTWIVSGVCLFTGIVVSFQYTNYVDRKSNQQWCDVVALFNEAYRLNPPPGDLGKRIAAAMLAIPTKFHCS